MLGWASSKLPQTRAPLRLCRLTYCRPLILNPDQLHAYSVAWRLVFRVCSDNFRSSPGCVHRLCWCVSWKPIKTASQRTSGATNFFGCDSASMHFVVQRCTLVGPTPPCQSIHADKRHVEKDECAYHQRVTQPRPMGTVSVPVVDSKHNDRTPGEAMGEDGPPSVASYCVQYVC